MEEEKNRTGSVNNNINSNPNSSVNTTTTTNTKNIDNSLDKKTSDNNQVNNVNSFSTTSSPLKDAVSNIGSAVLENNKYKSRRSSMNFNNTNDTSNTSNDFKASNTPNTPNANNSSLSNSNNLNKKIMPNNMRAPYNRGNKANSVLNMGKNVVSNLHPALKAINMANNIKNTISSVMPRNNDIMTDSSDDNGPNLSEDGGTTSILGGEEQSEDNASNPVSSILGSKNKISGGFSFLGRLPTAIKIGLALIGPLLPLIVFILVPIVVIGYFSSFWGLDRVLASNGISSGSGGSGSISYGDYTLSSSGDQILHTSIDSFLASNGSSLEEFNNLITSNVNDAGYGTRAGVGAAAVTLIAELGDNYNVKIPYFWGGGHGRVADGVVANWGSNECHTYANGTSYNYCGLDCSGFVSWAIYNGGYNMYPMSSGSFSNLAGAKRVSLKNSAVLQPGDLLDSNGHVILVVDIDEESKEYICAEASGNTTGVLFSRHPFNLSGYWGVDLEGFYKTEARS